LKGSVSDSCRVDPWLLTGPPCGSIPDDIEGFIHYLAYRVGGEHCNEGQYNSSWSYPEVLQNLNIWMRSTHSSVTSRDKSAARSVRNWLTGACAESRAAAVDAYEYYYDEGYDDEGC